MFWRIKTTDLVASRKRDPNEISVREYPHEAVTYEPMSQNSMDSDPDKTSMVAPMPFAGPDNTTPASHHAAADPDETAMVAPTPPPPGPQPDWQSAPHAQQAPAPAQWTPPPAPPAPGFGQAPGYGGPAPAPWPGGPGQFGAPAPQQPGPVPGHQPWNAAPPAPGAPPMGFGGPQQPPAAPGYNHFDPQAQAQAPGFGQPGFGQPGPQAPGFGAPQPGAPFGQPGAPYGAPAGQQQTPVEMAKSALNKSGSFIFRTMIQGVRGELIQQPWFQSMRSNPQGANQMAFIGTGVWALLALLSVWGGGMVGVIIAAALGLALIYVLLALGTKTGAQCAAYGVCGIGVAGLLYVIVASAMSIADLSSISSSSPYMPSTSGLTVRLVITIVISGVIGVAAGYISAQIQSGMKKIAASQY